MQTNAQIGSEADARWQWEMQAIQRLPISLQEAVQTRMAENCSVKEVASRLNISESAAKSRLYRARVRLGLLANARYRPVAQAAISDCAEVFSE